MADNTNDTNNAAQLDFAQAMADFKVMFPDMDADVIEAVLRSNNGAVDTTIDHLLAMSADNDADNGGHKKSTDDRPPSYNQATDTSVVEGDLINLGEDAGPVKPRPEAAKKSPVASPEHASVTSHMSTLGIVPTQQQLQDVYEANLRSRTSSDQGCTAQYLEDERIALMLQNEEFMAELRRDSDLLSALDMDSSADGKVTNVGEFRDKIKNMGKTSRKKFSQMAAIFAQRRKKLLGQSENAEPLVNDDSDDDDNDGESDRNEPEPVTKGKKYTSFS